MRWLPGNCNAAYVNTGLFSMGFSSKRFKYLLFFPSQSSGASIQVQLMGNPSSTLALCYWKINGQPYRAVIRDLDIPQDLAIHHCRPKFAINHEIIEAPANVPFFCVATLAPPGVMSTFRDKFAESIDVACREKRAE